MFLNQFKNPIILLKTLSRSSDKFLPFFLLLILVSVNGDPSNALTQYRTTYEVMVSYPVSDNNFVKGRKEAVKIAMKKAVEDALKDLLNGDDDQLNSRTLKKMVRNARRYVKSYHFLSAMDNLDDMTVEVEMEITLFTGSIRKNLQSLGVLTDSNLEQSIALLIKEKSFTSVKGGGFWESIPISETALLQQFAAAGIPVVSRTSFQDQVEEATALKAVRGDMAAIIEFGMQVGVDRVIVGTAVSSIRTEPGDNMLQTVQANISLKVVSVSKALIVAAKSEFATVSSGQAMEGEFQAFEEASSKLSEFLLSILKPEPISSPENVLSNKTLPKAAPSPLPPSQTPLSLTDL